MVCDSGNTISTRDIDFYRGAMKHKYDLCENGRCKAKTIEDMEPCVNYQKSEGMYSGICIHIVSGCYNGGECRVNTVDKEAMRE
jgi:hypothetical protein